MTSIQRLLSISSEPLSWQPVTFSVLDFDSSSPVAKELFDLLQQRNGFYAFESALHIFPAAAYESEMTLSRWNSFGLWRHEYGELDGKRLFFAEDAFGDQFCLDDGEVCSFESETGKVKYISDTLEGWAKRVLEDYKVMTGFPLMHEWQRRNGRLTPGTRLIPSIPFILGGDYALENLNAADAVKGMKFRGMLAGKIKNLPDGTQIQLRFTD